MISLHVMLQKPNRGYRKCPFCGYCVHTNLFECSCGYNWLDDTKRHRQTQPNKKVKNDLSINRGTKYCFCGEVIGKNTLRCKWCGYEYHTKCGQSKPRKKRVQTLPQRQYKTDQEALIHYYYKVLDIDPASVIKTEIPTGKCPHELLGSTPKLVNIWCQKVVDNGLKSGILYLPKALLWWFRQSEYLKDKKKRKKAERLINEWCGLGTCSEVVKNSKRTKRSNR